MEALYILQIVLSVAIVVSVLLQKGVEGLGTVFGGSVNQQFRTRRGFEAFIFNVTIFAGVMFVANAVAIVILNATA